MDPKQGSSTKVLMLPWLAHGHITPFLELAKTLSTKNFEIYLCSTPINLSSIQNRITETQYSLSIKLTPLHLSPSPELPPHHHTTNGLPPRLMPALINAFEMASPSFSHILRTLRPDLVIYDIMLPWAPIITSENKIPAVEFMTTGAAAISLVLHMDTKPDVEFPFTEQLRLNLKVGERGRIVEGWAPQSRILAHPSTGGFLSHCGWNSILESLKFGVPIIAMPMNNDQPINGKLIEEVGFGVEVKRDENMRVDRENIAQVIRKVVVVEGNGVDVRIKARQISEIIRNKGEEEINGMVQELAQLCFESSQRT